METTLATCDFCDTYSTLFFAMYFALVAVIVSDAFEWKWCGRKKKSEASKDKGPSLEAKDGTPPSQATQDGN